VNGSRRTKCVILAGGYGTRLQSVTGDAPKALIRLVDKTLLDLILEKIDETEAFDRVFVAVNQRYERHFKNWAAKRNDDVVELVVENHDRNEAKLGAVNALSHATRDIHDDCLVVACDNVFSSSLRPLLDFFKAKGSAVLAVYDIKDLKRATALSTVVLDEDSRVTSFEEKPKQPKSTVVGTGLYLFPAKVLHRIQEYVSMSRNIDQPGRLIEWLHRIEPVYGYTLEDYWCDVGTPETYIEAQRALEAHITVSSL